MKKKTKLKRDSLELHRSLTEAISVWLNRSDVDQLRIEFGLVGRDLSSLMAKAAIACLEASADVQDYLRAEAMLKD